MILKLLFDNTGRKPQFPAKPERAQFPLHFPIPVLQKCRNGTGQKFVLSIFRKHDMSLEKCRRGTGMVNCPVTGNLGFCPV